MRSRRCGLWALGAIVLAAVVPARVALSAESVPPRNDAPAVKALAEAIDREIARQWAESNVEPAPRADDAEFLRRVWLDLAGTIPTAAEARAFLDDTAADKRERLVEALLQGPAYVNHATSVWRALLLPEAEAGNQAQFLAPDFEAWLRRRVADNVGYDTIARELVAMSMEGSGRRGINPFDRGDQPPSPVAYYLAKQAKPENLAASTARTFLGIRIECAQCHDHPFASWKREAFWGFAAFFGGIEKQGPADAFGPIREIPDRRELTIPGSERVVRASFLDGSEPRWRSQVGSRVVLADWMTARDNPYFARAGANRIWAQLFGTGLVDPVDDLNDANPPSHPDLLDELAREFAGHGYDPKFLIRALTSSRAYQLTSDASGSTQDDPHLFSRMAVKGLTPEQLFASLLQATGRPPVAGGRSPGRQGDAFLAEFLQKFSRRDEKPTEAQTSILQALTMMNGRLMAESTSAARGPTLGAVAEAPFLDTGGKVEALFLAALSRRPRPQERARLVEYVERKGVEPAPGVTLDLIKRRLGALARRQPIPPPDGGRDRALGDVFWALLNSPEFLLNH